ncbi:hypothetical protein B0H10DRAFT_814968 [Mycena sp. CBHHK59/15]|nr:hypothetical protein B0H10DRAFT_814968 [Mycena sp. CBHHK59/15]
MATALPGPLDPLLPPEIEREIFECAALSHPKSIPALLLIAQRVKIWIEPRLFRIISVDALNSPHGISKKAFLERLESRPASFWRDHVRHLSLGRVQVSHEEAVRIFSACSGVSSIAQFYGGFGPTSLPSMAVMPLVRLSTHLGNLFGTENIDFGHPVFAHLTHMDLFDTTAPDSWSVGLGRLPCLTHISFNFPDFWVRHGVLFRGILAHCTLLDVFALICVHQLELHTSWMSAYGWFSEDPRTVLMVSEHYVRAWELGQRAVMTSGSGRSTSSNSARPEKLKLPIMCSVWRV